MLGLTGDIDDVKFGKLGNGFSGAVEILEAATMDCAGMETSGRVSTGDRYFWMSAGGYADDSLTFPSLRPS